MTTSATTATSTRQMRVFVQLLGGGDPLEVPVEETDSVGDVKQAALDQGRALTLLRRSGAACDHTVHPSYPEGHYLPAVLAVGH